MLSEKDSVKDRILAVEGHPPWHRSLLNGPCKQHGLYWHFVGDSPSTQTTCPPDIEILASTWHRSCPSVTVVEQQHVTELAFVAVWKTTLRSEFVSFSKSTEQTVPPGNVAIIKLVEIELMMDGMVLRSLQEVPEPMRVRRLLW